MDKKIIYIIVSIFAFGGIVAFFIFKKPKIIPIPAPVPVPFTTRGPFTTNIPEPTPKNLLEDAYFMSKKLNKDTDDIKTRLCKTLNAKTLFPDIW